MSFLDNSSSDSLFPVSSVAVALVCVGISYFLFRRRSKSADSSKSLVPDKPVSIQHHTPPESNQDDDHELANADKVLILFGTQTGNAETFARQLSEESRRHRYNTRISGLNDIVPFENLAKEEGVVVILTSTFGEGEPPDNAADFWKWLISPDRHTDLFKSVNFTVFGLGNRQYEHYQAMGRGMDKYMEQLGGQRFFDRGEGDDDGSLEEDFTAWKNKLWPVINAHFAKIHAVVAQDMNGDATPVDNHDALPDAAPWRDRTYKLEVHEAGTEMAAEYDAAVGLPGMHSAVRARLVVNRELHGPDSDRSCRHVEIDLSGTGLSYEAGDHLGVYPENDPEMVDAVAHRLGVAPDTVFSLTPTIPSHGGKKGLFEAPCTVRLALARFCDLTTPPRKLFLKALIDYAEDAADRDRLEALTATTADAKAEYSRWVLSDMRTPLEVLNAFPSVRIPLDHFLELVPRLQPRYYSISSSSKEVGDRVHITVAVVHFDTPAGRCHRGVCSTWLATVSPEKSSGVVVPVFVRHSAFKLPQNISTPVIMIGPGTGFAPFRGFLQDLNARRRSDKRGGMNGHAHAATENGNGHHYVVEEQEAEAGPVHLYFGCRHERHDFIYADELHKYSSAGLLSDFQVAFSRMTDRKVYVQDKLYETRERVWELISAGAVIYVCGDARAMAKDVHRTLNRIVVEVGGKSEDEARALIKDLQQSGRYLQDVWF